MQNLLLHSNSKKKNNIFHAYKKSVSIVFAYLIKYYNFVLQCFKKIKNPILAATAYCAKLRIDNFFAILLPNYFGIIFWIKPEHHPVFSFSI